MLSHLRPRRSTQCLAAPVRAADAAHHREHWDHSRRHAARITPVVLALALAAAPAAAQRAPEPTPYARAIAAGYKAAMYCSGIFSAGRTPQQIDRDELTGIYPEYDAIVPTLPARVDAGSATVLVAYDPAMPPRRSSWRPGTGCTIEPIGAVAPPNAVRYRVRPAPAPADPRPWPMGDAGIAPRPSPQLARIVVGSLTGGYGPGGKTTGVVVLRDGRIVAERYAPGWGAFVPNRTWSVGKSIAGTLVGLATAGSDGAMAVNRRAGVAQWRTPGDPRSAIQLDHLLRMSSGLYSSTAGNRTDAIYFGGTAVDEEAVAWPLAAPPGTRFRYANNDILLALLAFRHPESEQAYQALPTRLFRALGMRHTQAGVDWRGNYVISSQIWSTARDLARLGQFWLQDGVWQGKPLLAAGWVCYMTTPRNPQPTDGPGYGATMWLFGPKQGLPVGSYAAQGNRGQYVTVIPSAKLVIVRRGEDPGAARFDIARFSADVLAAVR